MPNEKFRMEMNVELVECAVEVLAEKGDTLIIYNGVCIGVKSPPATVKAQVQPPPKPASAPAKAPLPELQLQIPTPSPEPQPTEQQYFADRKKISTSDYKILLRALANMERADVKHITTKIISDWLCIPRKDGGARLRVRTTIDEMAKLQFVEVRRINNGKYRLIRLLPAGERFING